MLGGFCYGTFASAATHEMGSMNNLDASHCADEAMQMIKKSAPFSSAVLPCCIDRHDNVPTTLTPVTQERIKFSQALVTPPVICALAPIEQKIFSSSPAPPEQPDILSSVIKIE